MVYLHIFLYKNSQSVTSVKHFQTKWRSEAWGCQTDFRSGFLKKNCRRDRLPELSPVAGPNK